MGSYICQWLEVQRAKLIVQQTKYKKEIADIEEDEKEQQINTRVIGFQTTSSSDEEEEEEYEDD